MTTQAMPVRATKSLWQALFGGKTADASADRRAILRQARIDLADLPDHLKMDIGLFND